jgi:hypothetical protein
VYAGPDRRQAGWRRWHATDYQARREAPVSPLRRARAAALLAYLEAQGSLFIEPETLAEIRDRVGLTAAQLDAGLDDLADQGKIRLDVRGGMVCAELSAAVADWEGAG